MTSDTARTCSAYVFVLCIIAMVLLAASGCKEFAAYLACFGLLVMAAFVGSTQSI